jgi:hypothetical protein
MSSPNPLEKKLDRYYEDIIEKIMEIIEAQKNILGEQKEIRKDVAKLKEHLLLDKLIKRFQILEKVLEVVRVQVVI